ncbi:MAG: hypothetical protein NDJ65_00840 [Paludibacteraceae bacterium]|nr:hypothetical protein [Paludibacteraceae bacterium]
MKDMLITLLGSGLLATLISCLIPVVFFKRERKFEYELEYHKKLLDKRISSYNKIERIAYFFSSAVQDSDGRPYHFIFSTEQNPFQDEYIALMTELTKCNLWISDEIRSELLSLNRFLFENKIVFTDIEKGKKFYKQLGEMSDKIISVARKDMLNLTDLNFLRKQGK